MKIRAKYFIPVIGIFIAIVDFTRGLRDRSWRAVLASIVGVLINYLLLFLIGAVVFSPSVLKERKKEIANFNMDNIDSLLELAVLKYGQLPDSLDENGVFYRFVFYNDDPYINRMLHKNIRLKYVKIDSFSYELRSIGPDGEIYTNDDIVRQSKINRKN